MTPLKSRLSFEVASIKPVEPLDARAIMSGRLPGISVDKAFVHISNERLMDMVRWAYRVSRHHVVGGPVWLSAANAERFDIVAKMPDGATQEQAPEMLQTLLAERFGLVAHREKRDGLAYALTVRRGGARLKEAAPELNVPDGEGPRTLNGENGRVRFEFDSVTMERFASLLSRYLDRPVVDRTGLEGRYQAFYEIDLTASAKSALARLFTNTDAARAEAIPDPRDCIVSSLKQLGLKLDSRVLPVDVLVIDRIERTPTKN